MTIEHARKVLGKSAEKRSDQEIRAIITFIEKLVNRAIDSVVENK